MCHTNLLWRRMRPRTRANWLALHLWLLASGCSADSVAAVARTALAGQPSGEAGSPSGPAIAEGTDCEATEAWPDAWARLEAEVVRLVNQQRAHGAVCGAHGRMPAAGPLVVEPRLRCAARLHARDLGQHLYFAHLARDGRSPFERLERVGYAAAFMGENLGRGQTNASQLLAEWMASDSHCANLMRAQYREIGVGYFGAASDPRWNAWAQSFGSGDTQRIARLPELGRSPGSELPCPSARKVSSQSMAVHEILTQGG